MQDNLDPSDFWEHCEYARQHYVEDSPTGETVARVEASLGYRLPAAYLELMRSQNGGSPLQKSHHTSQPTSWAEDHIAITGVFAIGHSKPYSLCGERGSRFWIDQWGYPAIGVYFADCPSAGHDMLCLDYRACGPRGEPTVVHVDQGRDFAITLVAPSFRPSSMDSSRITPSTAADSARLDISVTASASQNEAPH